MITAEEFQTELRKLLEEKMPEFEGKISFDFVEEPDESYIWIDVKTRKKSWDKVYFQRIFEIDIQVILLPDNFGIIKRSELWKITDKLDAAIMPCIKIKDRFITVQEFNSYIFDEILHYEFVLDFTDYVPNDDCSNYELMKKLEVDLNKDTSRRVFFDENGDE